jgi:hypothetical protein
MPRLPQAMDPSPILPLDPVGAAMKPIRTADSNLVYTGPPGVGDLHCQRIEPGVIRTVWHFSKSEREAIAQGATLALEIFTEPVPPVGMAVGWEQGIGEDAPDVLPRLEQLQDRER